MGGTGLWKALGQGSHSHNSLCLETLLWGSLPLLQGVGWDMTFGLIIAQLWGKATASGHRWEPQSQRTTKAPTPEQVLNSQLVTGITSLEDGISEGRMSLSSSVGRCLC